MVMKVVLHLHLELFAESDNPNAVINWFDSPINGNLLFTGNTFTTDILNTTTSYLCFLHRSSSNM